MIYELRTYNCIPGGAQKEIDGLGKAYPGRSKYSEVGGIWYTDIGPLNQVISIWPYENLEERLAIRSKAASEPDWPPDTGEFILDMNSEIYFPTSFCPSLKPGAMGPVYEMRTYTIKFGFMQEVLKRWEDAIEKRIKLSPLLLAMVSEHGPLNRFVHIWPYESLQHRTEIRAEAIASGHWPPNGTRPYTDKQDSKIMLPANFSPQK